MMLKDLLDSIHEDIELSTAAELKAAVELIVEVQGMGSGERDCIYASFKNGPLFDGDVPSKVGRNSLLEKGYLTKVVVQGCDGFNACTNKGARAFRLIEAGA